MPPKNFILKATGKCTQMRLSGLRFTATEGNGFISWHLRKLVTHVLSTLWRQVELKLYQLLFSHFISFHWFKDFRKFEVRAIYEIEVPLTPLPLLLTPLRWSWTSVGCQWVLPDTHTVKKDPQIDCLKSWVPMFKVSVDYSSPCGFLKYWSVMATCGKWL